MPTLSSLTAKGQEATRGKSKSAKHRPSSGTTLPSISESDIASKIDYDLNCPIARSISVKDVLSLPEFETFNIAVCTPPRSCATCLHTCMHTEHSHR